MPLLSALGGCLLLAVHDLAVLLTMGLMGALLCADRQAETVTWACGTGLTLMASGLCAWKLLPGPWHEGIAQTRLGSWLTWWSWRDSARLALLRLVYFAIVVLYAAVALQRCGVQVDTTLVAGVIPLVLLADALPSVSGLGTRETALLTLLDLSRDQQAVLLSFSLLWSVGLIIGRLAIGLAHYGLSSLRPS